MADSAFTSIEQLASSEGAVAVFDHLIGHFRNQGEYGRMFEARLMKKRLELGAELMPSGHLHLHGDKLKAYDKEMVAAATETARLYLESGRIAEAWPYYRALGDAAPIKEAIERLSPDAGGEGVIDIALGDRVHPRKGFEMLLVQHGICRAITLFDQYPDAATREDALLLLTRTLYGELVSNVKAVIARNEGAGPETDSLAELIATRDWLFGDFCYHVDVSHLMSVVRMSAESDNAETLRLGREMARYGTRLSGELQYKGDPPFEDLFRDYAMYLDARMGDRVEEAIAHFRAKVASYDYDQIGTYPAQTLVRMLLKLGRPAEAVRVFEEFVGDTDPNYLSCPTLAQLCKAAGDYERMRALAEKDGDLLRYAAAVIEGPAAGARTAL